MKFPQDPKRFSNLNQGFRQIIRRLLERMQRRALAAIGQELGIGEGEEWAAQRGKDRKFIGGPLDRSEGVADRVHLLPRMERGSADEQRGDLMSFQSSHKRAGN